jgi:hypothetical protein
VAIKAAMLEALMPFPLASSANCLFQALEPAAVLPHCAASAFMPRHASTANAVKAAVAISLPLIIQTPFAPFGRRLARILRRC